MMNKPQRYAPGLTLKIETVSIQSYGTEVLIKTIPGEIRPGCLDPREHALALEAAAFYAKNASGTNGPPTVTDIRNMMGFPNLNMNTVEILTRFEELQFGGRTVGLWSYWPRKPIGEKKRPAFLFLHGGGWVGGSPFTVENPCRLLAERGDAVVFNVDYSLAPESPFPNGLNDCFSALAHIYTNADSYGIDLNRIGIGGDSAGGNLAAVCAQRDRDRGTGMLALQALIYPAVTLSYRPVPGLVWDINEFVMDVDQRSLIEPGLSLGRPPQEGAPPPFTLESLYLQNGVPVEDPSVSPLLAEDHRGLCKTLIAVAEFDGLRIQGEFYGKTLRAAGVDVRLVRYNGVGHAFVDKLGILPQAEDLVDEIARALTSIPC
jgi:acetyl esterase